MSDHLNKTDLSFIRYANVWEDADILLDSFRHKANSKMLSIASAGDNALAMLSLNPSLLVAVDLNPSQLFLTELKIQAIKAFEREEYLKFIGFEFSNNRLNRYKILRNSLGQETRAYWDNFEDQIDFGIINTGKFEKYLKGFANKILPFIHGPKVIEKLFGNKTNLEQQEFFRTEWNTWRWKLLFKIFFSKFIMGRFGRDPEFLKQVTVNVSDFIYNKSATHLSSAASQSNHILEYCLKAKFEDHLPFYARENNYQQIKENLGLLKLYKGYAQDAISNYGKFDAFNLSNIFEYMPMDVFESTAKELIEGSNSEAILSYWNLMVDRRISQHLGGIEYNPKSVQWTKEDKGFFYKSFISERII